MKLGLISIGKEDGLIQLQIICRGNERFDKPLVILDAGHGGHNCGARVKNPYLEEKRLTLQCTFETKRILEKLGYRISLTRMRDFFCPFKEELNLLINPNRQFL